MDRTIIVALLGIGGTLLSPIITLVCLTRRDKGQREHEENMKRMELEDKRGEHLREERRKAYIEFATINATIDTAEPFDFLDLKQALSRIELVAHSEAVVEAARALDADIVRARKRAREVRKAGGDNPFKDAAFQRHFDA